MKVLFREHAKGLKEAPSEFFKRCKIATRKTMEYARQQAIKEAPGRSGNLKGGRGGYGGIRSRTTEDGRKIRGLLTASAKNPRTGHDYAVDLHEGTGLYGPKRKVIRPKNKKVLVFPKLPWTPWPLSKAAWKNPQVRKLFIFTKKVKGIKPNKFMLRAMDSAQKKAPSIFDREIKKMNQYKSTS